MEHRVTLAEVLDERERRGDKQRNLIATYNQPVVSFTMNIPGEIKDFPLSRFGFIEGYETLINTLKEQNIPLLHQEYTHEKTGSIGFLIPKISGVLVKQITNNIETNHPLGRLFDMDVVDVQGKQISGKELGYPPRTCFVCGKDAFGCGRSRAHSVEELFQRVLLLLWENPSLPRLYRKVSTDLVRSILYEATASPKPGLVDPLNSGSHKDMDFFTFLDSSLSLSEYFSEITQLGFSYRGNSPVELFHTLRESGMAAEKAMFAATNGVNTHKGIIFSLGLIGASYGQLLATGKKITATTLAEYSGAMTAQIVDQDFYKITMETAVTNGEMLYAKHGVFGIRGEAREGFPTVINYGLPAFRHAMGKDFHINDGMLYTLLHIMTKLDDTNILARQDFETLESVKEKGKALLAKHGDNMVALKKDLALLDEEFTKNNMSPGGGADLLAVTMALYFLEHLDI